MALFWEFVGVGGALAVLVGQIWLFVIIARGSVFAALLCLIVPFLWLFFIRDHWEAAKPAVICWCVGVIICLFMACTGPAP